MKALICTGGLGTRLRPLTVPLNKHLLPVYNKPMIQHVVELLVEAGVTEIMLGQNALHPGLFEEMLGSGEAYDCNLYYRYTQIARDGNNTEGAGRTMLLAREWAAGENIAIALGDAFFAVPLDFRGKEAPHAFLMPLDDFDDPRKYSNVRVEGGRVKDVWKKPKDERYFTNLIETGMRIFPPDAFERLDRLSAEKGKSEVEVSDLTMEYIREGAMRYTMLPPGLFIDCGTPDALLRASLLAYRREHGSLEGLL